MGDINAPISAHPPTGGVVQMGSAPPSLRREDDGDEPTADDLERVKALDAAAADAAALEAGDDDEAELDVLVLGDWPTQLDSSVE